MVAKDALMKLNVPATEQNQEERYQRNANKDPSAPIVPFRLALVVAAVARATASALGELDQK